VTDPKSATVVVRRVLPAPPELVYDEWLDPSALAEFITPAPSRSGRIEIDSRVGGRFQIEMVDLDRTVHIVGEYLELERPSRLRFTWRSDLGRGFDSVVTITLDAHGDGQTMMTIEHARLPLEWAPDHEAGWTRIAAQLGMLAAGAGIGRRGQSTN